MRRLISYRYIVLLTMVAISACGSTPGTKPIEPTARTEAGQASDSPAAAQQLADAMQLVSEKDWPQAQIALRAVIDAKTFGSLPGDVQYRTLRVAGHVFADHGQLKQGYDYLVRAGDMPQSTFEDQKALLMTSGRLQDWSAAMNTLTVIGQRYPAQLSSLDVDLIADIVYEGKRSSPSQRLPLLQALYDANWRLQGGVEPSETWRDLTLMLLDKGELTKATDVATHVQDVYVLIAMRSDRRFDAVITANPAQFDIAAASEREYRSLQQAADNTPHSLALKTQVIIMLLQQRHYEAALAAADSVLLDIRSTNFPRQLFEDYDDSISGYLDVRATTLERVGRWDEALEELTAGSNLHQKFWGNIDQIIDLAELYCSLRRPHEAVATLARMTARTNASGSMQVELARLQAAVQLGDSKQVERSLQYLAKHRADGPSTYVEALVFADKPDRAAHALIEQLLNKDQRQEVIVEVQTYDSVPGQPWDLEFDARWRTLIARKDVLAAIEKVGRVNAYPLEPHWY
jgi:tetratricopeptide (TPR) repeat protein